MVAELLFQEKYLPNVNLEYFNIAELLHNALVAMVAELMSQRTYVPNVKSKYFNKTGLVQNALAVKIF